VRIICTKKEEVRSDLPTKLTEQISQESRSIAAHALHVSKQHA
jgi:hypothetical protein